MIFDWLIGWVCDLLISWLTGWALPNPASLVSDFMTSFGYLWTAAGKMSNWISWWAIPPAIGLVFGCWFAGLVIFVGLKIFNYIVELL